MPSSFDVVTESPASVEHIYAAYTRKDYWLARIEPGPALTTLDSLIVEDDGTVKVHVTQHIGRQLLPGPVGKLVPTELRMLHSETWRPDGDGQFRGHVRVLRRRPSWDRAMWTRGWNPCAVAPRAHQVLNCAAP